jgi:hypothetical protein
MGLGLLDNQSKPIDHQYLGMAYAVTPRQLVQGTARFPAMHDVRRFVLMAGLNSPRCAEIGTPQQHGAGAGGA